MYGWNLQVNCSSCGKWMVAHQSVGGNSFGRIVMHKIFHCKIAKTLYFLVTSNEKWPYKRPLYASSWSPSFCNLFIKKKMTRNLLKYIAMHQFKMAIMNNQTLNFCGVPHNQFKEIITEKSQVTHNIQLEKVISSLEAGPLHTTWERWKHHLGEVLSPNLKLYSHISHLLIVLVFILE